MPRLDYHVDVDRDLTYDATLVLRVLIAELNVLRQQLGLPVLHDGQVRQAVRQHLRTHPRPGRPHGPTG